MPLKLNDVTLVCIDDVAHDLASRAIADTLDVIDPAAIITWSSRPLTHRLGSHNVHAEPRSLDEVMRLLWYDVPTRVMTSHFMVVQWDGWATNASAWDPRWLFLDYIGAPWGWHGGKHEVGNGGFSLRSTLLARWVARSGSYPAVRGIAEDEVLCRTYRHRLEIEGFIWATVEQAERFAYERAAPRPSFGFHGAWNWPAVMDRDKLAERAALANDYVKGTAGWRDLRMSMEVAA